MKFKELRELLEMMHAAATAGQFMADGEPMTVEQLDGIDVIVRVQDDDGNLLVGNLQSAVVDAGCTETYALVIDGGQQ